MLGLLLRALSDDSGTATTPWLASRVKGASPSAWWLPRIFRTSIVRRRFSSSQDVAQDDDVVGHELLDAGGA